MGTEILIVSETKNLLGGNRMNNQNKTILRVERHYNEGSRYGAEDMLGSYFNAIINVTLEEALAKQATKISLEKAVA